MSVADQLDQILAAAHDRLTAELHNRDTEWTAARCYARTLWAMQDDLVALATHIRTEGASQ